MAEFPAKLGISPDILALFNISDKLEFDYGDGREYLDEAGHRVPSTKNLCCHGNDLGSQVIIAPSVLELLAFAVRNSRKFTDLQNLFFIAIGNNWQPAKISRIRACCKKQKFMLVFANDLPGRLADIKTAAALRGKSVAVSWSEPFVLFTTDRLCFQIEQDLVSLASFERLAGIRTNIRTAKPYPDNTYLDQLINYAT